jgi:hypothetical protein
MWAGIAGAIVNGGSAIEIALSVHDSVYNTDFASACIPYNPNEPEKSATEIEKHVIQTLRGFSKEHLCKFLGAGITLTLLKEVCRWSQPWLLFVNMCDAVPQLVYEAMVGCGCSSNCIQHQALSYKFLDQTPPQTSLFWLLPSPFWGTEPRHPY